MEAVFPSENFRIFSGQFRLSSCIFWQEPVGNQRKKSENYPVEILLPFPAIFRVFPQDRMTFPASSCRFLEYPFSGIIVLGYTLKNIRFLGNRPKKVSERSETFLVGFPENGYFLECRLNEAEWLISQAHRPALTGFPT
jgi:hypothetical protein